MKTPSKREALKDRIAELISEFGRESDPGKIWHSLTHAGWPKDVVGEVFMENYGEFPVFENLRVSQIFPTT